MNRLDMTEQERSVQHARVHSVHSLMGMREAEAPAFRRRRISLRHHQRGGGYMTVAHLLRNPFSKQTSDICFHAASIVVALFYYVVLPRRPSLHLCIVNTNQQRELVTLQTLSLTLSTSNLFCLMSLHFDVWPSLCRMTYVCAEFVFTYICWGGQRFLCAQLKSEFETWFSAGLCDITTSGIWKPETICMFLDSGFWIDFFFF